MHFDYIMAGGGCAGLSLAYHLHKSQLQGRSILIIDREEKTTNDRTWCFWTDQELLMEEAVSRTWSEIDFHGPGLYREESLDKPYKLIRSRDFYRVVQEELRSSPHVHWHLGDIKSIDEHSGGVAVAMGDGQRFTGDWCFNSCYRTLVKEREIPDYHYMKQHFLGWFLRTEEPTFHPGKVTLMDFRIPQKQGTDFVYVLPFSETEALVEYTIFSKRLLDRESYELELRDYMANFLGVTEFEITEYETGSIPMTDYPFPEGKGERILHVGTAGGATKPTTGYTFLRIQEQSRQIVGALERGEQPDTKLRSSYRFRFYDRLLLRLMDEGRYPPRQIFMALFRNTPINRVLKFLDESTNILEEVSIFWRLPWPPFLRAAWQVTWKIIRGYT